MSKCIFYLAVHENALIDERYSFFKKKKKDLYFIGLFSFIHSSINSFIRRKFNECLLYAKHCPECSVIARNKVPALTED